VVSVVFKVIFTDVFELPILSVTFTGKWKVPSAVVLVVYCHIPLLLINACVGEPPIAVRFIVTDAIPTEPVAVTLNVVFSTLNVVFSDPFASMVAGNAVADVITSGVTSSAPEITRANGCGPSGIFVPLTFIVYNPTGGDESSTCSTLFTLSNAPFP